MESATRPLLDQNLLGLMDGLLVLAPDQSPTTVIFQTLTNTKSPAVLAQVFWFRTPGSRSNGILVSPAGFEVI